MKMAKPTSRMVNQQLKCRKCQKPHSNLLNLQRHSRVHSSCAPFKCHACGREFKHLQQLKLHRCTLVTATYCKICRTQYKNLHEFKTHHCDKAKTRLQLKARMLKDRAVVTPGDMLACDVTEVDTFNGDKLNANMCVVSHGLLTPKTSPNGCGIAAIELPASTHQSPLPLSSEDMPVLSLPYTPEYQDGSPPGGLQTTASPLSNDFMLSSSRQLSTKHRAALSNDSPSQHPNTSLGGSRFSLDSISADEMSDEDVDDEANLNLSTSSYNSLNNTDPMFQSTGYLSSSMSLSIQVDEQSTDCGSDSRVAPKLTHEVDGSAASAVSFDEPPCLEAETANISPLHVDSVCDEEMLQSPFRDVISVAIDTDSDCTPVELHCNSRTHSKRKSKSKKRKKEKKRKVDKKFQKEPLKKMLIKINAVNMENDDRSDSMCCVWKDGEDTRDAGDQMECNTRMQHDERMQQNQGTQDDERMHQNQETQHDVRTQQKKTIIQDSEVRKKRGKGKMKKMPKKKSLKKTAKTPPISPKKSPKKKLSSVTKKKQLGEIEEKDGSLSKTGNVSEACANSKKEISCSPKSTFNKKQVHSELGSELGSISDILTKGLGYKSTKRKLGKSGKGKMVKKSKKVSKLDVLEPIVPQVVRKGSRSTSESTDIEGDILKQSQDTIILESNQNTCTQKHQENSVLKEGSMLLDNPVVKADIHTLATDVNMLIKFRQSICELFSVVLPEMEYPERFHSQTNTVDQLVEEVLRVVEERKEKLQNITQERLRVSMCADPRACLHRLRSRMCLVIQALVPGYRFEDSFCDSGLEVDSLVRQVIAANRDVQSSRTLGSSV